MTETRLPKGKMRTVTVAALLGVFVGAVVLAIGARFLPGRLTRLVKKPGGGARS
jgi:hypothetical protein